MIQIQSGFREFKLTWMEGLGSSSCVQSGGVVRHVMKCVPRMIVSCRGHLQGGFPTGSSGRYQVLKAGKGYPQTPELAGSSYRKTTVSCVEVRQRIGLEGTSSATSPSRLATSPAQWEMLGTIVKEHDEHERVKSHGETTKKTWTHVERSFPPPWANRSAMRFVRSCMSGASSANSTSGKTVPMHHWMSSPAGCTSTLQRGPRQSQGQTSQSSGSGIKPPRPGTRLRCSNLWRNP